MRCALVLALRVGALQKALDSGNGAQATDIWGQQQQYVGTICGNCNWYDAINSTDTDAQEAVLNSILATGGDVAAASVAVAVD